MLSPVPLKLLLKSNILIPWLRNQFYSQRNSCDVIYLNLIANPADNISFERVVNELKRGVGPGTEKIRTFAYEQNMSLL